MKKTMSIVLSLLLFLCICPGASAEGTAEAAAVTVTVGSGSCLPAREITIPICIEGNPGFSNLAIALEYDRDKLSLTKISPAEGICGAMYCSTNTEWKKADGSPCGFLGWWPKTGFCSLPRLRHPWILRVKQR